jgi:hypothetical protein
MIVQCPTITKHTSSMGKLRHTSTIDSRMCQKCIKYSQDIGNVKYTNTADISECPKCIKYTQDIGNVKYTSTTDIRQCPICINCTSHNRRSQHMLLATRSCGGIEKQSPESRAVPCSAGCSTPLDAELYAKK